MQMWISVDVNTEMKVDYTYTDIKTHNALSLSIDS